MDRIQSGFPDRIRVQSAHLSATPRDATLSPALEALDPSATPQTLRRIIKFGGAAITQKSKLETLQQELLRQLCTTLAAADGGHDSGSGTVVVHGAGSFGVS